MNFKWLLLALSLSSALSGCLIDEPNKLEFDSDPLILRGSYTGTIDTRHASDTVALSADNTVLAMGTGDGRAVVQLWDVATRTPIKSMGALDETDWYVTDVAIAADGSAVASLLENRVQLWDSQTGKQLTLDTAGALGSCLYYCVTHFDLSSDGRFVAVGGDETERAVLFDAETGAQLKFFELPSVHLETLAFSADGTRLVALSTDPLEVDTPFSFHVRVWNPLSGEVVFSGSGKSAPIPQLDLSADGRRLAFTEGRAVRVIEVDTAQEVAVFELPQNFTGLALNPDGNQLSLATFADGETARTVTLIFDTTTRTRVAELNGVNLMGWSQDGTLALAYGVEEREGPSLLDAATFDEIGSFVHGKLHEVVLEATPSYVDAQHYTVSGTLRLDGGSPITVTGKVEGSESQRYLSPQARLPNPAELTLELQGNPWIIHGFQEWRSPDFPQKEHLWNGYILDTTQPSSPVYGLDGTLTLDRADGSR